MTFTHRTGRLDRDATTVYGMESSKRVIASVYLEKHCINLWGLLSKRISLFFQFRELGLDSRESL